MSCTLRVNVRRAEHAGERGAMVLRRLLSRPCRDEVREHTVWLVVPGLSEAQAEGFVGLLECAGVPSRAYALSRAASTPAAPQGAEGE